MEWEALSAVGNHLVLLQFSDWNKNKINKMNDQIPNDIILGQILLEFVWLYANLVSIYSGFAIFSWLSLFGTDLWIASHFKNISHLSNRKIDSNKYLEYICKYILSYSLFSLFRRFVWGRRRRVGQNVRECNRHSEWRPNSSIQSAFGAPNPDHQSTRQFPRG